MLGKLFSSPSLAYEFTCFSIHHVDISTLSDVSLSKKQFSSRVSIYSHANVIRRKQFSSDLVSNKWSLHSTGSIQSAVVVEDQEKAWKESRQLLTSLNFSSPDADVILKKAFGWVNSPYWGEERNKVVPKNELLNGTLDYLRSLGLSDDDLHKLLKKFPEVLGCSLDDEVKTNIATLEREWGIKGKTLRSLLLRNPKVLGYNVDCKGDCIAKCTRCWVRF